ncbi:DUF551 domain-containing protein [Enterobacter chuandaensis]|uniref:DUF551 domain-containing protein n=1 Tax=Enterobacter chuandaensis TaxID=2497875 RepID=UPI00300CCBEA
MSNIDKQAVQAVADLKAGYTLGHADVAILNELARIALASLEAEPVAYIIQDADARSRGEKGILRYFANISDEYINEYQITVTPLYTATPAPVSVPDEIRLLQSDVTIWKDRWELLRELFREVADALGCDVKDNQAMLDKIEMLQGAEPVTTANKLPANTPCKDAPEHIWLQTAGVWPENGEFSELTWCSDNQHKDDTLYVRADVVSGNSPVIPDGWVAVPVEPTEDMIVNGFESEPDERFSDAEEWEAY